MEAAALAAFLGPAVPSTRSPLVILVGGFVDLVVMQKVMMKVVMKKGGQADFSKR